MCDPTYRPIVFSGEMVQGYLSGVKGAHFQIEPVYPQPYAWHSPVPIAGLQDPDQGKMVPPPGAPGCTLWVQEEWRAFFHELATVVEYKSDPWQDDSPDPELGGWRSAETMPHEICRLAVKVVSLSMCRIQDLNLHEDFVKHWDEDKKPPMKWDANPWVWVVKYEEAEVAHVD